MSFFEGCFGPENAQKLEENKVKLTEIRKRKIQSLNKKFPKKVASQRRQKLQRIPVAPC